MQCPCNPTQLYKNCCEKAHTDIRTVETAEELMRSRYSAFVLANIDYLQKSHYSKTRPSKREKKEIEDWTNSVHWVKLAIVDTIDGLKTDTKGVVEFKAFFMEDKQVIILHEKSNFCKENGHWVYVDGSN
ncbi:YchJ family protein [Cellulophaga fucicola]|uniref:SEC-C motif-containing protein n=1 Tax=Cellulophaga fucicola TaxID=76595 RepID=A0A1K1MS93_9FLAO|nr:YchJ family metal-binding protein [Cellulophaga fucicola]SFW25953.1 SEC-C motif-containing protein [Cellulophaga fucicola]